jgi:hypothetical protein
VSRQGLPVQCLVLEHDDIQHIVLKKVANENAFKPQYSATLS